MKDLVMQGDEVVSRYVRKEVRNKSEAQNLLVSPGYCLLQDLGDSKVFGFTRPLYIDEMDSLPPQLDWVTDPIELAKCKSFFEKTQY
jgi:hypothetical protein